MKVWTSVERRLAIVRTQEVVEIFFRQRSDLVLTLQFDNFEHRFIDSHQIHIFLILRLYVLEEGIRKADEREEQVRIGSGIVPNQDSIEAKTHLLFHDQQPSSNSQESIRPEMKITTKSQHRCIQRCRSEVFVSERSKKRGRESGSQSQQTVNPKKFVDDRTPLCV